MLYYINTYIHTILYIHRRMYNIGIYTEIYIICTYVYIERDIHVDICIHEIIKVTIKTSDFTLQNK